MRLVTREDFVKSRSAIHILIILSDIHDLFCDYVF